MLAAALDFRSFPDQTGSVHSIFSMLYKDASQGAGNLHLRPHSKDGEIPMSNQTALLANPLSLLLVGFVSLIFVSSCGGGGGGDKARDACEELIEASAVCLEVPLSNDELDEGADLCEDELIDEADDLGGGDCVDAVVDLIECVAEDCDLIALLLLGNIDPMDFDECAEEIEELGEFCDG